MASPYPKDIPLESDQHRPIRKPYSNITKSLNDPQLEHLSKNGPLAAAPEQSGASTKASAVPVDLSTQRLQALAITNSGLPMRGHGTSAATGQPVHGDGSSVSSSGSSCLLNDKSAYGTFNDVHVDQEVAHMATWVDDSLGDLNKKDEK